MSDGAAFASAGSDRAIVAMPEAIDITNSAQISEQLNLALLRGVALVVADFTPTSFCDSSGVRELALARKRAAGMHVDLRAVVPSAVVLRAFELAGLDGLLPVYASLAAALDGGPAPGDAA